MARQQKQVRRSVRPLARRNAALPEVPVVAPAAVVPMGAAAAAPESAKPAIESDQIEPWLRRMIEAAYT